MRDLSSSLDYSLKDTLVSPAFFLELDWPQDPVYWWTGYGTIEWDDKVWQGTANFMKISQISESADARANGVQLTLSGISNEVLVSIFRNDFQGRKAQIYFGLFRRSINFIKPEGVLLGAKFILIKDPLCIFDGVIDSATLDDSGETSTAVVNLEKELIDRRDEVRRFTHEDQQIDHPGDRFFEYQTWLSMNPIKFGKWKNS